VQRPVALEQYTTTLFGVACLTKWYSSQSKELVEAANRTFELRADDEYVSRAVLAGSSFRDVKPDPARQRTLKTTGAVITSLGQQRESEGGSIALNC
jgi:hypothetical protein